ncbi:MAG TPA: thiolase family protein [Solirubrobacterales bacterium]
MAGDAVAAALADAGLGPGDVDGLAIAGEVELSSPEVLGIAGRRPACRMALGASALHAGWDSVATGVHDVVVCVANEPSPWGGGNGAPSIEALAAAARGYMRDSGTTERHLARVAAKNRGHGASNPRALLRSEVDPAEVLASEPLAGPLRSLMVARPAQGAAAVVFGSGRDGRRGGPRAPRVRASVHLGSPPEGPTVAPRVARLAYFAAGLGPEDVDLAEIEDATPAEEISAYEALELAPYCRGYELVDSGFTSLGGVVPVNTSGGTLAQGLLAVSGALMQLVELAQQLRGRAGRRQVPGARVGLALAGGGAARRAPTSVTILSA